MSYREELLHMAKIGVPMFISYMSQQWMWILCLHYVGQLGPLTLAGVALGAMFSNCSGCAVILGLMGALDTLLYQAYGADKKSCLLSVYIQRAFLLGCLSVVFIGILWQFAEPILDLAHQDPQVAKEAGTFVRWNILMMVPMILFEVFRKFLSCLEAVHAVSLCSLLVALGMPLVFGALIRLGLIGAPLSMALGTLLQGVFCVVYVWRTKLYVGLWYGFSRAAFADWGEFLALGIPSALMLMAEWGSQEINGMVAGTFGMMALDTMSISMNLMGCFYMAPMGFCIGVSVRMGNHLGSNDIPLAKRALYIGFAIHILIALVDILLLNTLQRRIPKFFTEKEEIEERFVRLVPYLTLFHMMDVVQALCNGVIRAMGFPKYGFAFVMLSYSIGLPFGWLCALHLGFEERGLWLGPSIGLMFGLTGFALFFWRLDWEKAAKDAKARISSGNKTVGKIDIGTHQGDGIEDIPDVVLEVVSLHHTPACSSPYSPHRIR